VTRRARAALPLAVVVAAGVGTVPAGGRPAAPGPRVSVVVAGPHGVLLAPHRVRVRATRVRVGRRSCAVRAGSGLAALAGARRAGGPALRVRDDGACSPGALFVTKLGPYANRGVSGWTYKVGHRAPSVGAGTRTAIHAGTRVLWFWCETGGRCQRTLDITAPVSVAPGAAVRVRVRGYDDQGRGRPARGALVRLGAARARTGAAGTATLTAPAARGPHRLTASGRGVVPAFPERVRVR
jgi:hypothetical protein